MGVFYWNNHIWYLSDITKPPFYPRIRICPLVSDTLSTHTRVGYPMSTSSSLSPTPTRLRPPTTDDYVDSAPPPHSRHSLSIPSPSRPSPTQPPSFQDTPCLPAVPVISQSPSLPPSLTSFRLSGSPDIPGWKALPGGRTPVKLWPVIPRNSSPAAGHLTPPPDSDMMLAVLRFSQNPDGVGGSTVFYSFRFYSFYSFL